MKWWTWLIYIVVLCVFLSLVVLFFFGRTIFPWWAVPQAASQEVSDLKHTVGELTRKFDELVREFKADRDAGKKSSPSDPAVPRKATKLCDPAELKAALDKAAAGGRAHGLAKEGIEVLSQEELFKMAKDAVRKLSE